MRSFLIGVDEVGRELLLGRFMPRCHSSQQRFKGCSNLFLSKLKDSKRLSPNKRLSIYTASLEYKLIFGVGVATVKEIDQFNVLNATMMAMARAINQCVLIAKLCLLK